MPGMRKCTDMKPRIRLATLYLAVGAALNFAIALIAVNVQSIQPSMSPLAFTGWPEQPLAPWPQSNCGLLQERNLIIDHRRAMYDDQFSSNADAIARRRIIAMHVWYVGFPFRSMACRWDSDTSSRPSLDPDAEWISRSTLAVPLIGFVHIPTRPLWFGLVFNTILFATLLFLLLQITPAARRVRRVRKGLCARCAYPRKGILETAKCPECGASPTKV